MTIYEITPELAGSSLSRKLWRFVVLAGLYAVLQVAFDFLLHSFAVRGWVLEAIEAIISGVIFAAIFTALLRPNSGYRIIVSDDRITAVHPWFKRFVERGDVRTVIETPGNFLRAPALRISKHGRLGMRLWGGVFVPRALPQCDSIRDLALQWRVPPSASAPTPH